MCSFQCRYMSISMLMTYIVKLHSLPGPHFTEDRREKIQSWPTTGTLDLLQAQQMLYLYIREKAFNGIHVMYRGTNEFLLVFDIYYFVILMFLFKATYSELYLHILYIPVGG